MSSVRACLMVLVLACVLPAVAAAAAAIVTMYQDGRAASVERARAAARSVTKTLDKELAQAMAGLQALATAPALLHGDLAAFHAQAVRELSYLAGNNVVLSTVQGQQVMNTLLPLGTALPAHGNPALQRKVLRDGRPAVSDLFVGGVTRRPLVAVEVPVQVGERVTHSLAMGFFPERFAQILEDLRAEPTWHVSIYDSTGTIIARTHNADRFVGLKGSPAIVAALPGATAGTLEYTTLDGVEVLAAFARSSASGWSVAVGIPRRELMLRAERSVAWLAGVSAALLVIGGLVARSIAVRITGSMHALLPAADALGRGEPVQPMHLGIVEAQAVASAMDRASRLLRARTAERDEVTHAHAALRSEADRLADAAQRDVLTGLPNRAFFLEVLRRRLADREADGSVLTVLYIDIDDFKPVNDTHGHAAGDELLVAVATRLRTGIRDGDLAARLGGDEFAVLLDGLPAAQAYVLATHMMERLSSPYAVRGVTVSVSACIGIASFPAHGRTVQALLEAADAAMYRAKAMGKRHCVVARLADLPGAAIPDAA